MSADRIERQLSLARQGLTPPSQLSVRVRASFGASERSPGATTGRATARAGSAALRDRWRALRASGNLGIGVGAGLFGLGCIVGLFGSELAPQRRDPAPVSAPLRAAEVSTPDASRALAPPAFDPEPASRASLEPPGERAPAAAALPAVSAGQRAPAAGVPRRRPEPPPPRRAARDWRGELELLERAERALRADNVALALALLGDFDVRYPRSRLVEERAAVETMAHCQAAATDSGARAARFLNLYPNSLYRTRVEALCRPAAAGSRSDKELGAGH